MRQVLLVIALALIGSFLLASPRKADGHYRFILPDGYVGWIQVVFNDPDVQPFPWKKGAYEINVPESGIPRTCQMGVSDASAVDEFLYLTKDSNGGSVLRPVPSSHVLPGFTHGGFYVRDTGGRGLGSSWFIFVGPPDVRAKTQLADWYKVVDEYKKAHGGKTRIESTAPYPVPGRMREVGSRK